MLSAAEVWEAAAQLAPHNHTHTGPEHQRAAAVQLYVTGPSVCKISRGEQYIAGMV